MKDRVVQNPRKENRPITSRHLATTLEKREGSPGNPSFPHSLTFLLPLSLFFFFLFSIFLLLLQSLAIRLAAELHGRLRDPYMMISFFSWCFCIQSSFSSFLFFSSSFFHFLVKLARHHHGPLLRHHHWCPQGSLVLRCHAPVALGRRAILCAGFSYCGVILGVRSSRIVSTLMPKYGLGQVTLTRFQPNPKKTKM